jgi:hypothetical protein
MKVYMIKVKNGIRYEINGWTYLSVKGSPSERGYAHGYLVAKELKEIFKMLEFNFYEDYGMKRDVFSDVVGQIWGPIIQANYPELHEEIVAITKGANAGGCKISLDELIMWNCFVSVDSLLIILPKIIKDYPQLNEKYGDLFNEESGSAGHGEGGGGGVSALARSRIGGDHCSGFMAVGSYTKDGKIICGHNTFDNFMTGQYFKYILDIKPTKGARILMQTAPGNISSETDFYVTSNGFMATETTIGGFNQFALKDPICCRIRTAMQYGKTLDEIKEHLVHNNSGDYANAWLIGDTNTNTIMRVELGLKYVNVEKKKDGYFIGFNGSYDPRIRNLECSNVGHFDIRRHQGARKVRLTQLMQQHKGKIDIKIAEEIMADHHDVYLNKINPSSRTCCSHYELDDRAFMSDPSRPKPFQPRGALDGKVCDTNLAKKMSFMARWGSACGMAFDTKEFIKRNIVWEEQEPYLLDRPSQPWTEFTVYNGKIPMSDKNITKRKEEKVMQMKKTKKNKLKL